MEDMTKQELTAIRFGALDRAIELASRGASTDLAVIELALRLEAYVLHGKDWERHCA
jgi:hypothetical protein